MQNEMKMALNDISTNRHDNSEHMFLTFTEKFENLEGHFMDFKGEIVSTLDEKIKWVEERLMKKFEDILGKKFGNILETRLETQ